MNWYGARSLYLFGIKDNGKKIYEERVVVFSANDFAEAHKKAELEAETYAKENEFEFYPDQTLYKQDGLNLIDGYEVWSVLYESDDDIEIFYQKKYEAFLYSSED